jgi:hypothetical protein
LVRLCHPLAMLETGAELPEAVEDPAAAGRRFFALRAQNDRGACGLRMTE